MEHFVPFEEVGMSGEPNRYNELSASQKLEVDKLINNIASKDAFLVNGSLESVLPDEELCEALVRFGVAVLGEVKAFQRVDGKRPTFEEKRAIEENASALGYVTCSQLKAEDSLKVYEKVYEDLVGRLRDHANQAGILNALEHIEDLRDVLNNPQNDELGVCDFHADGRRRCGSVVEHILRAYTQGQQTLIEEPVYADGKVIGVVKKRTR